MPLSTPLFLCLSFQEHNNQRVDEFALELIARYGKDPYNMKDKLKKYNFKNLKISYVSNPKKKDKKKDDEKKKAAAARR